jgi:hypothetical protein
MEGSTRSDTGRAELVAYVMAALILVVGGAFVLGPILNFISGPAIVVACVSLTTNISRRLKRRREAR